jgi:hypothetical protein
VRFMAETEKVRSGEGKERSGSAELS